MMRGGKRVLIPDGEYTHTLKVVRALGRTRSWTVHVCTSHPESVIRFSRFASRIHEADPFSPLGRVEQAAAIARRIGADVILPVGEEGVRAFSEYRDLLPAECSLTPVPDPETFDLAVDKGRLAAFLDDCGLPVPATLDAADLVAGRDTPDGLRFPVLCKPKIGAFGRGITRVDSVDELLALLGRLGDPENYLVQEFARGRDVDVSVLCRAGEILASTVQREHVPAPTDSFEPPQAVRFCRDETVEDLVRTLLLALGWSGVAHVDLRENSSTGDVRILEINARFWGSVLGSVSAGVNIPHLACLAALGEPFPEPEYRPGLFFTRGITGRLSDRSSGWSWRRSNLPYVLGDPLPELVSRLRWQ